MEHKKNTPPTPPKSEALRPEKSVDIDALTPAEMQALLLDLQAEASDLQRQNEALQQSNAALTRRVAELESSQSPLDPVEAHQIRFQAQLLDAVGQAVIAADLDGTITYWNRAAETLYGWRAEEVLGRDVAEVTPAQTSRRQAVEIMARLSTGESWSGEFRVQRQDGSTFVALVTDVPIQNEQGNLVGLVGVSADITDQKHIEQELRKSEERFNLFMEHLPGAVFIKDAEDRLVHANSQFAQLIGVELSDLIGRKSADYTPPELLPQYLAENETVLAEERVLETESSFPGPDGPSDWLTYKFPILRDDRPVLIGAISLDITERKRTEAALQESEERYRRLVETSPDSIVLTDLEGHILVCNNRTAEIYGCESPETLLGRNAFEFIAPEDRPKARANLEKTLAGIPVRVEYRMVRQDGSPFFGELSAQLIRDAAGYPHSFIGVTRDVTERKQTEEAYQALIANPLLGVSILRSGQLVFVNETMAEMSGYRAEELLAMPADELNRRVLPPADRAKLLLWQQERLADQPAPTSYEYRLVRKDGSTRWVEQFAGHISYQGDAALQAVTIDITARKEAERQRGQYLADLRLLNQGTAELLTFSTEDEIFAFAGEQLSALLEKSVIIVNKNEPDTKTMQIQGIYGLENTILGQSLKILGYSPVNRTYPMHPEAEPLFDTGNLELFEDGLPRLASGHVPELVTQQIQKLIKLNRIYLIGLKEADRLYAGVQIYTRDETSIDNPELIETFIRQVAIALHRVRAETALRESEARYRQLFDQAHDAIHVVNEKDEIVDVNQRACELFGYSRKELLAMTVADLQAPEVQGSPGSIVTGEVTRYGNRTFEMVDLHRDGRRIPVDLSVTRVYGADGPLYMSIVRDITKRKEAEKALRRSIEERRVLLDLVPVAITITDETGRIIDANRMSERLLGITPEEHTERRYNGPEWQIIRPDGSPMPPEEYASVRALQEQRIVRSVEMGVFRPDGQITWISVSAAPIPLEGYGVAIAYADITDRKQAEEALQQNQLLLDAAQKMARIGGWEIDLDSQTLTWTEETYRIHELELDYTPTVEKGIAFFAPEAQPVIRAAVQEAIEQGRSYDLELPFRTARGNRRWVRSIGRAIQEQGRTVRVTGAFQDITEQKQAQKALQQYTDRLELLHQIDTAILAARSPKTIAKAALHNLRSLIPYSRAGVSEVDLKTGVSRELIIIDAAGDEIEPAQPTDPLPLAGGVTDELKQGRPQVTQDITTLTDPTPLEQYLHGAGIRAYVSTPLLVQGELTGALSLGSESPNTFTPEHIEISREVANSLAVALHQARLYEQTERDARTRATLLKEVNHRVANNLAAIMGILELELDTVPVDVADFQAVLLDMRSRIESMVTVHHMLSATEWAPLQMAAVSTKIIQAALSNSPIQNRIGVTVTAPPGATEALLLTPKQGITLALIINELTTNSVKYAFQSRASGQIELHIAVLENHHPTARQPVRLKFRDDGPGWPADVLAGRRQNIGLELVQMSATYTLGGEIDLTNDGGAVAAITFRPAPLDEE